jgi:hypothetical protein
LLGKVISKNLIGNSQANLLRRAAVGNVPMQDISEFIEAANKLMATFNPTSGSVNSAYIETPWLEVLPIAVFV